MYKNRKRGKRFEHQQQQQQRRDADGTPLPAYLYIEDTRNTGCGNESSPSSSYDSGTSYTGGDCSPTSF